MDLTIARHFCIDNLSFHLYCMEQSGRCFRSLRQAEQLYFSRYYVKSS